MNHYQQQAKVKDLATYNNTTQIKVEKKGPKTDTRHSETLEIIHEVLLSKRQ